MQTAILNINGMTCMGCVTSIKKVLEEKYGHVNINLEDGTYIDVEDEEDKKD